MSSTEDDTFKRLKRAVDYNTACAIYSMAAMHLQSDASLIDINALAEPELNKVGWTVDELYDESEKKAQARNYDGRYG